MNQRGFTLPELAATVVMFIGLLIAATFLLHRDDHTVELRNAERRLEVAQIAQAVLRYKHDTGQWPERLPEEATVIGTPEDQYNLCKALVPKYMKDIPLDPTIGTKARNGQPISVPCDTEDVKYVSAYTIVLKDGFLEVSAPLADGKEIFVLTATASN